ncbi:hypothetical protein PAPHI01_1109 [Pancytospora philotis]|nr:hypothetical protein PAPHI01_1109 [Pancytospora philotis]
MFLVHLIQLYIAVSATALKKCSTAHNSSATEPIQSLDNPYYILTGRDGYVNLASADGRVPPRPQCPDLLSSFKKADKYSYKVGAAEASDSKQKQCAQANSYANITKSLNNLYMKMSPEDEHVPVIERKLDDAYVKMNSDGYMTPVSERKAEEHVYQEIDLPGSENFYDRTYENIKHGHSTLRGRSRTRRNAYTMRSRSLIDDGSIAREPPAYGEAGPTTQVVAVPRYTASKTFSRRPITGIIKSADMPTLSYTKRVYRPTECGMSALPPGGRAFWSRKDGVRPNTMHTRRPQCIKLTSSLYFSVVATAVLDGYYVNSRSKAKDPRPASAFNIGSDKKFLKWMEKVKHRVKVLAAKKKSLLPLSHDSVSAVEELLVFFERGDYIKELKQRVDRCFRKSERLEIPDAKFYTLCILHCIFLLGAEDTELVTLILPLYAFLKAKTRSSTAPVNLFYDTAMASLVFNTLITLRTPPEVRCDAEPLEVYLHAGDIRALARLQTNRHNVPIDVLYISILEERLKARVSELEHRSSQSQRALKRYIDAQEQRHSSAAIQQVFSIYEKTPSTDTNIVDLTVHVFYEEIWA